MSTGNRFRRDLEFFIKDFVNDLTENNVAIFAGAGLSKAAGYVDWCELLCDIATELGLSVDKEYDLISLAQYHVNENRSRTGIIKKIIQEFTQQAEPTKNHRILAQLPITTFWTTNYDTLIEDSLKSEKKVVDVKYQVSQLAITRPKRDVVIYKMHGDIQAPNDAIITKEQYEKYHRTHEHFITALSGDLVSKTFLFIGFSFNDPNLDYVFSRLSFQFSENPRKHYCFIKNETDTNCTDEELNYKQRKQALRISDLKRYGIHALLIDDYSEITKVLEEIAVRYKQKTIFISGSAEEFGSWNRTNALNFIHLLCNKLIQNGYTIVSGFGWNIGSAVINGALDAIFEDQSKYSEDQLVMRPFPQNQTGNQNLPDLWEEYRQSMISKAGIAIFLFGNKRNPEGKIVSADGMWREFEISISQGLVPIPVASTGYVAQKVYDEVITPSKTYYIGQEWIIDELKSLAADSFDLEAMVKKIVHIINSLNK